MNTDIYKTFKYNEAAREFCISQSEQFPGCDEDVIAFIARVRCHMQGKYEEAIDSLFLREFCYYFAVMLKDAFQRGIICNTGSSHIVWLDGINPTKDIAYDITGVSTNYTVLIPVKALGAHLNDFKHTAEDNPGCTANDILRLTAEFSNVTDLSDYI